MKKRKWFGLFLGVSILFAGGCQVHPSGKQMDLQEKKRMLEEDMRSLNTPVNLPWIRNSSYPDAIALYWNGEYLCVYQDSKYRYNFTYRELEYECDIPGCAHNSVSCNAKNKKNYTPYILPDGSCYYPAGNRLMYRDAQGKEEIIVENQVLWNNPGVKKDDDSIGQFLFDDDFYYIQYPGELYIYHRDTKEFVKKLEFPNAKNVMSAVVAYGKLAYVDDYNQAICCDIETGEITRLTRKSGKVAAYDGHIYYIEYQGMQSALMRLEEDGSSTKVVDDCWVYFTLVDDHIWFEDKRQKLWVADMDGTNVHEADLALEDYQKRRRELNPELGEKDEEIAYPGIWSVFYHEKDHLLFAGTYFWFYIIDTETEHVVYAEKLLDYQARPQ